MNLIKSYLSNYDGDKNNLLNFSNPETTLANSLSQIEQEIFDELTHLENEREFGVRFSSLELLKKIFLVKNWMNELVLRKVKWYLKVLLALNISNDETMKYLKENLIDLLNIEELEYWRSLESPFLVWCNRDENWKIVPIYWNRVFKSKRNVVWLIMSPSSQKEVALIPWAIKKVWEFEIMKTDFWDLLPNELREIFESWNIIQTIWVDLYDLWWKYHIDVFKQDSQNESIKTLDDNITIWAITEQMYNGRSEYLLLYYWELFDKDNWRTWVLFKNVDWKLEPVKVEIDWIEYIVEIKWCWLRRWWFKKMSDYMHRTWKNSLQWACEKEQAIKEFKDLNWIPNLDWPKIAWVILFYNNWYEQWQIIRLSPSTVRASYTWNKCYEDIETPSNIEKILDMYVKWFEEMIFADSPRIISRSSHTENILLWGVWNFCWTDYSDQLFLNANSLPFNSELGWFLTVKKLLFYIVKMRREIPWYSDDKFKIIFIWKFIKYFWERGIDLDIRVSSTDDEITQEIWENFLAYHTFKQKFVSWFYPESIDKSFEEKKGKFLWKYDWVTDFSSKLEKAIKELINYLEKLLKEGENVEFLELILLELKKWNLNKVLLIKIWYYFFGINDDVIKLLIYIIDWGSDFRELKLFMESEIDMLESAYSLANEEEKAIIALGINFYKFKLDYIEKIDNYELSLDEIFNFIKTVKFWDMFFSYKT